MSLPDTALEAIQCPCALPYEMTDSTRLAVAGFLRQLANRVEWGEVRHVSLSIHPGKRGWRLPVIIDDEKELVGVEVDQ